MTLGNGWVNVDALIYFVRSGKALGCGFVDLEFLNL